MATNNTDQGRGTPSVFILCRNLLDNTDNGIQCTVHELYTAAEKTNHVAITLSSAHRKLEGCGAYSQRALTIVQCFC